MRPQKSIDDMDRVFDKRSSSKILFILVSKKATKSLKVFRGIFILGNISHFNEMSRKLQKNNLIPFEEIPTQLL